MDPIDDFLRGDRFAVVGASRDRAKYGNRVLRALVAAGREVVAVNPREREIEGVRCVAALGCLDAPVWGVSVVTPPAVTAAVVEAAAAAGIERVWMQPGAESAAVVARARELGLTVIAGGPCLLVALGA